MFPVVHSVCRRQDARGCIMGLTQHTKKAHIVRALIESVGFQLNEIVVAMLSDMEMEKLELIRVDGGMSRNGSLLQVHCQKKIALSRSVISYYVVDI